jgi:hypothetical protein
MISVQIAPTQAELQALRIHLQTDFGVTMYKLHHITNTFEADEVSATAINAMSAESLSKFASTGCKRASSGLTIFSPDLRYTVALITFNG